MIFLALLVAVFAFALLGLASDPHHHRRLGGRPMLKHKRRMHGAAWTAIAVSLALAVLAQGWVFGPVLWAGLLMLAAGIVFLSLNFLPSGGRVRKKPGINQILQCQILQGRSRS